MASRAIVDLTRGAALTSGDVGALVRQVTELAATVLGVQRTSVWRFEGQGRALRCADLYDAGSRSHRVAPELVAADYPLYFAALRDARVIAAVDAQSDPATAELTAPYLAPLDIRSLLDAPIWHDGGLEGVVCHESVGARRDWTAAEAAFAASMGDVVSLALQTRARLTAQAALQEATRLDAEGRFAAGVAHDFSNILQAVRARAEIMGLRGDASVASQVAPLLHAADRGQALVRRLTDYARTREPQVAVVELGAFLTSLAPLAADVLGTKRRLVVTPPPAPCAVRVDPLLLERALINLIANARAATAADVGVVEMSAELAGSLPRALRGRGDFVRVEVRDNGVGMNEETRSQIRDAWYTTRGGGTGLGLAIVQSVATGVGGAVVVDSELGEGTRVSVFLPLTEPPAP